jgi:hypothetical protein
MTRDSKSPDFAPRAPSSAPKSCTHNIPIYTTLTSLSLTTILFQSLPTPSLL